jgi:6-phosphogluconolactonase
MSDFPHSSLKVFHNTDELNQAALDFTRELLAASRDDTGEVHIALAGGSTPHGLYRKLAEDRGIDWDGVHLWFGDERTVPPDHPDCNFCMVRDTLLVHIPVPEGRIHRMRGEIDPAKAAAEYETRLTRHIATKRDGRPVLDLVLLGMGDDGHTASLFPNTDALQERERLAVENAVPQLDTTRITLTYPVLNAARNVLFLVAGESKAQALAGVVTGGESAPPAACVRPVRGDLLWYVDHAAASLLP